MLKICMIKLFIARLLAW